MCMGHTHAISGALSWLSACDLAAVCGVHPTLPTIVVGAGICAGFALAPDFDHPSSLIANTYGPITRWPAKGAARLSRWAQLRTRTPMDYRAKGGHRWLLHTWPAALALGLVVSTVCGLGGKWAIAAVMFISSTLAIHGLLSSKELRKTGQSTIAITSAFIAIACGWMPDGRWWWTGLAAALGALTHCWGDTLTEQCCPWLWPIKVSGRRWYPVGLPRVLRLSTGSKVELYVVVPVLGAAAAVAGWYAVVSLPVSAR